jgi:hypothetical protein
LYGKGAGLMEQIGIALFGVLGIWLTQDKRASWRRWACIAGMCSQPFWLFAAIKAGQWGAFFISCLYTIAWARGIFNNWIKPASAAAEGE